jgi:type II secretion system protein G
MAWICACGQQNEDPSRFCSQCGAPREATPPSGGQAEIEFGQDALPVPPANLPSSHQATPALAEGTSGTSSKKKSKALPVILILLAVGLIGFCVIGIIAAIAIPNFLAASQKARQARAVADLRAVGAACQQFRSDKGAFPDTGHDEGAYYSIVSTLELKSFLEPDYTEVVPVNDPWGNAYSYGVSQDNTEFILICDGSDGKNTLERIPETPITTSCFEDEIVFENGDFVQKPEGPQKKCK